MLSSKYQPCFLGVSVVRSAKSWLLLHMLLDFVHQDINVDKWALFQVTAEMYNICQHVKWAAFLSLKGSLFIGFKCHLSKRKIQNNRSQTLLCGNARLISSVFETMSFLSWQSWDETLMVSVCPSVQPGFPTVISTSYYSIHFKLGVHTYWVSATFAQ